MEYYFSKTINDSFENAQRKLQQLKGRIWSTNRNRSKPTLKKKLDVDFTITPFWEPAIQLPKHHWQKIK
jgi:hypothetical protein